MTSLFRQRSSNFAPALLAACALLIVATLAGSAKAVVPNPVNKYTFNNGNANDSIGAKNGTVVDNTGISSYTGGSLNLTANNTTSGQDWTNPATVGAFVDLPNGVFTDAVIGGTFGQVTVETWVTVQQNKEWSRIWDFGTSGPGEGLSGDSPNAKYVFVASQIGNGNNRVGGSTHNTADAYAFLPTGGPLSVNVKHHVVLTLDQNDFSGGLDGTARLFVDNVAGPASAIAGGLFLDAMVDNNNWIGRAQWNDQLFDGLVDEFRIYNVALTPAQVTESFTIGPDPVPLPVLTVNRGTGEIAIKNPSGDLFNVKAYSIGSANGGLNPTGWQSINNGGTFDTNGTWGPSPNPLTPAAIGEVITSGATDGGPIAGGTSRTIGSAWARTPLSSDLTFSYQLNGGAVTTGIVEYIGGEPLRGDLNGDGAFTSTDWTTFLANHGANLAGQLPAVAYQKGDLDGNLTNDYADFVIFKSAYNAVHGAGSFELMSGVPEPATWLFSLVAAAIAGCSRRR
jgi:hypothetical protein